MSSTYGYHTYRMSSKVDGRLTDWKING